MPPTIAVTVQAVAAAPRPTLFAWFIPIALPRILVGYGPLPRVDSTSAQSGAWDRPGSTRTVHLAGGSTAREAVVEVRAPAYFRYRVSEITHPLLRRLVAHADGEWWFDDTTDATGVAQTRIRWRYTFTARSRAAAVLLQPIARVLWRGYMGRAIGLVGVLGARETAGRSGDGTIAPRPPLPDSAPSASRTCPADACAPPDTIHAPPHTVRAPMRPTIHGTAHRPPWRRGRRHAGGRGRST